MIEAKIVADSVSQSGVRIISLELTYPRFIHAELMTHRVFSRNSASSRAIPVNKMLKAIAREPAKPIHWGANQKGMQARAELAGIRKALVRFLWFSHRWSSLSHSWLMNMLGAHKQITNRLVEPHSHIKVLVTSTLWNNFIKLRMHGDAQPEMQELANQIVIAVGNSIPEKLDAKEWHLPYISEADRTDPFVHENGADFIYKLRLISAARCARISYTTIDRLYASTVADYKIGTKLVNADPIHASPLEHQATPDPFGSHKHLWGNFHGWVQHRKLIANEAAWEDTYATSYASKVVEFKGNK